MIVPLSSPPATDVVSLHGRPAPTAAARTVRRTTCGPASCASGGVRRQTSPQSSSPSRTHSSLAGILPAIDVLPSALFHGAGNCGHDRTAKGGPANHGLFLLASAAAAVVAYSLHFVGATATPGAGASAAAASAATSSIGSGSGGGGGASNGGGGGGGVGGGPSARSAYSSIEVVTKAKADEEVRKWDEDTCQHPYMVSADIMVECGYLPFLQSGPLMCRTSVPGHGETTGFGQRRSRCAVDDGGCIHCRKRRPFCSRLRWAWWRYCEWDAPRSFALSVRQVIATTSL